MPTGENRLGPRRVGGGCGRLSLDRLRASRLCADRLGNGANRAITERCTVIARHLRPRLRDAGERLWLDLGDALVAGGLLNAASPGDGRVGSAFRLALRPCWLTLRQRSATRFRFPTLARDAGEGGVFWRVLFGGRRKVDVLVTFGLPNLPPTHGRLVVPCCHVRLRYKWCLEMY